MEIDNKIQVERFPLRLQKFMNYWKKGIHEIISQVDAMVFCLGSTKDVVYSKTLTFHTWLFGYELSDLIIVITKESLTFLGSEKKIEFLQSYLKSCENLSLGTKCLVRKKEDLDKSNFATLLKILREHKKIGLFQKEKFAGEFAGAWKKCFDDERFFTVDITIPFALLTSVKDDLEIEYTQTACDASCAIYNKFFKQELISIIDDERKVQHSILAKSLEDATMNSKYLPDDADINSMDLCFPPIIQSGGRYALKFSVMSDDNNLHYGNIICSFGVRYRHYCSSLIRTLLVEPNKHLQDAYTLLLDVELKVMECLRPGVKLSEVYGYAEDLIRARKPQYLEYLTKSIGFGMGIEFRESALLINGKNNVYLHGICDYYPGMVFNVHVGFCNFPNPEAKEKLDKVTALFIGDTVLITEDGSVCLTDAAKKRLKNCSMFIRAESEVETDGNKENIDEVLSRTKRTVVLTDQLRNKETGEERRKSHQKELVKILNLTARERIATTKKQNVVPEQRKPVISYKARSLFPKNKEVKHLEFFIDRKYDSVVVPIFGVPIAFHITTVKNISQSIEGDFTYLRINFSRPVSAMVKNKDSTAAFQGLLYVKELTFRSSNLKEPGELDPPSANLREAYFKIKEVQKAFKARETEARDKQGIVQQDRLIICTNRVNPRLKDLFIRPSIVTKRISGTLEVHSNGFRYLSFRGDKVDIMFNNIKHAFFQPCDNEMIILIHLNLKDSIMFGKKKTNDVQFYTEVGEITTDLGRYGSRSDRDDLYAEQKIWKEACILDSEAERELRNKLNSAFRSFCDRVEKVTNGAVEFDTPFRDLGFYGAPYRTSVLLQPTSCCLVNLTDWPTFVLTLDEVELVHFERVHFQLKHFDCIFIFKDYSRKPAMVSAIPQHMLDHVKEWLDSCDIVYTEGIQSLNWGKVMKSITDDPEGFFESGGWNFLTADDDTEKEDDSDESEATDDVYEPDSGDEGESDDDSEEFESEISESSGTPEEDTDSGMSWSELEEEARRADRQKDLEMEGRPQAKRARRH
ncbi:FACT complex subunit SPT16 [Trichinella sp. T6]|nr:FACT complex subunit SPT16 [Trichinella sp. T6]